MGRSKTDSSQVVRRVADYDEFKSQISKKGLTMQVEESAKYYLLKAIEGKKVWVHQVWKSSYLDNNTVVGVNPSEEAAKESDFTANHKEDAENNPPTHEMNRDGKVYVHQTPTPNGATSYITSQGDDYSDRNSVGGGNLLVSEHVVSGGDVDVDVDFNSAMNKTWIYSGFAMWEGCQLDRISLLIMAKGSTTSGGASTNFTTLDYPGHPWHGKLIIPAAGDGDLDVSAPVLVGFYPNPNHTEENDVPAYWDATWNPVTKTYDGLTPNVSGEGEFNMFTQEIELFRFANNCVLNGSNNAPWSVDSRDAQRLGDGMFIRMRPTTVGEDHAWKSMVILFMHRERTC